jgi:hypothetical protein
MPNCALLQIIWSNRWKAVTRAERTFFFIGYVESQLSLARFFIGSMAMKAAICKYRSNVSIEVDRGGVRRDEVTQGDCKEDRHTPTGFGTHKPFQVCAS